MPDPHYSCTCGEAEGVEVKAVDEFDPQWMMSKEDKVQMKLKFSQGAMKGHRYSFVMHLVLVAVLVTIVSAELVKKVIPDTRFIPQAERLPCDFSCSRRTAVQTIADGVFYTMECLDRNGNNLAR
nr:unnamed protein product [Haemonchus contortus]